MTLRLGIAGLGTVGVGVLRLLRDNADIIAQRAGREIVVTAVSARDAKLDRGISLAGLAWHEDPLALAADERVDVVVELIGGAEGPAKALAEATLAAGKSLVTANKALLAVHGSTLARAAEAGGVALGYEAAVAGGIPVIKALREGLAGNHVTRVTGILNGTSNYILSAMRESKRDFAEVLAEAQALGYAEADPAFDINGTDAAHKLSLLAALGFGIQVDFSAVHVEGIDRVSQLDIGFAEELGYRIKLLGIARRSTAGIETRVHPALVPKTALMAGVDGVFNAVLLEGDAAGPVFLQGRGAGAGPTASAVVADVIDIARGSRLQLWGVSSAHLPAPLRLPIAEHQGAYYLRLMVLDRPGVLAEVTGILRDHGISLESMLQHGSRLDEAVPIILVTHETREAAVTAALAGIAKLDSVLEPPAVLRIEQN